MNEPARAKPNLVVVDTSTGEQHETCPGCDERERTYAELERKYRGVLSQLGNMRADKEAEARSHKLWDKAVTLWTEYLVQTGANRPSGRNNSKWTEARFWVAHPFLRDDGFAICRHAVYGIAAHPNRKQITPDYFEVYDSWELLFRDRSTFERYANRGAAIFGRELGL